jgi:hypothetical protein
MDVVILGLTALTSLAAYAVGRHRLRLPARALRPAVDRMLEGLGLAVVFFAANLAIGGAGILLGRAVSGQFVSLYVLDDSVLLVFSVLQGMVFAGWRDGRVPEAVR